MIRITDSFRTTLKECGLTYRQLEEKTGVDYTQFGRFKRNKRLPTVRELDLLCSGFGCQVYDIIEFVEG